MKVAHLHVIRPASARRGEIVTGIGSRLIVHVPGQEPFEMPGLRAVNLRMGFNDVDLATIELLGSVEVSYDDGAGPGGGLVSLGNLCVDHFHGAVLTPEDERLADEFPCCAGAAMRDAAGCTCWRPVFDLDNSEPVEATYDIQPSMCIDCAYRPDSPERADGQGDQLDALAREGSNIFWCHQGIRRVVTRRCQP